MSNISTASQRFRDGYACSQAIVTVYGEPLGLPHETAMQISAGFAAGMRMGETCGAVTGAFMVLGLRHAGDRCDSAAGRAGVYARILEFACRFKERTGSLVCRELLGCNISTPEGLKQAQEMKLFRTTCVTMVETAASILEEMEADCQAKDAGNDPSA
jgi:C_GCAxxG_C_C family probable redox protein